jgi:hypothetical protein
MAYMQPLIKKLIISCSILLFYNKRTSKKRFTLNRSCYISGDMLPFVCEIG